MPEGQAPLHQRLQLGLGTFQPPGDGIGGVDEDEPAANIVSRPVGSTDFDGYGRDDIAADEVGPRLGNLVVHAQGARRGWFGGRSVRGTRTGGLRVERGGGHFGRG